MRVHPDFCSVKLISDRLGTRFTAANIKRATRRNYFQIWKTVVLFSVCWVGTYCRTVSLFQFIWNLSNRRVHFLIGLSLSFARASPLTKPRVRLNQKQIEEQGRPLLISIIIVYEVYSISRLASFSVLVSEVLIADRLLLPPIDIIFNHRQREVSERSIVTHFSFLLFE